MPIDNVFFSIEPINPDVYRFRVDFFDNGTKVSSSNPLIFVQTKAPNADGMNVDLFTKNASSKSKAKDVLKQVWGRGDCEAKDIATIHSVREVVLPLIDNIIASHSLDAASKRQRLLVLDLNDSESKYANIDQIRACQKIVEQYLTAPCDKFQETYEALQQLDLQFMIGEGPLKYSLLRTSGLFDSVQQEFLTSKGNGKEGHCFLAEFLMNGFKFGQVAQLEGNSAINFQAQDYIDYIGKSSEPRAFEPQKRSIVVYPSEYKSMYSLEDPSKAKFLTTIRNVFPKIIVNFDEKTELTTVIIDRPLSL